MPEESRLGKLLMVAPPDGWVDGAQDWLDDLQPAGIILFKRNLPADFDAARAAVARLHEWAAKRGETLLVAADEEGGFVTQTSAWFPVPPAARALAWMGEPELVRQAFARYGKRLRHFGINLDFAPVCDVNNNPLNPVIGARSFATEAAAVTLYARAVHDGLAAAGVLSCAKHFPGHGDTDVDSHLALPVVAHDRARLEHVELVPFRALAAEVPVVMVAHVACPAVGDGALPATLSPRIATALLRHEVGFTGVAVTDAMDMQGVAGQFGDEEAAVRAVLAGCDLLLYCFEIDKPLRARAGLRSALASGRLSAARVEEAASRVRALQGRAAAAADPTDLPAASRDAEFYRSLCRRALRVPDPAGWRAFRRAVREAQRLVVTGSPDEVVTRLVSRLEGRDIAVETRGLDAAHTAREVPLLVVLGERRPLAPERVALLRRLALDATPIALANLLTPETDAPLAESFATILRSADHTDAMLDVVASFVLGSDPDLA